MKNTDQFLKIKDYFEEISILKFKKSKKIYYKSIIYKNYFRFQKFNLPLVRLVNNHGMSSLLKKIFKNRRSVRKFKDSSITINKLSLILNNCFGVINDNSERRSYPSAGARYPVETYVICVKDINGLVAGVYHYNPRYKYLELIDTLKSIDFVKEIFGENYFLNTSFFIVFTSIPSRLVEKYGYRGLGYMYIESGHMAQNLHLFAGACKVSSCAIGGFLDKKLAKLLGLREGYEFPIYSVALGG